MRSMRTRTRMIWAGVAVAAVALGVSGCAAGSQGYAVLERPAEARDSLPPHLPAYAFGQLEPESARFIAEDRGAQLYLVKGTESTACLLVFADEDWFSGCGGDQFTVASTTRAYEVWADGALPVKGATELSPNVFATR